MRIASIPVTAILLAPIGAQDQSAATGTPRVERIELGADRVVQGHVIKETESMLFLDLGFDVVRIPRSAILRRAPLSDAHTAAASTDAQEHDGVWFTRRGRELPVADAARMVGGAVVRIESPSGQGSGFLTSKDGHIVTNFHVVEGETKVDVVVYFRDGDALRTRTLHEIPVLAANPTIDLALIKIAIPKDLELSPVPLGDSDAVKVGDEVFAIGAPIGLDRTVSSGIVSVTDRAYGGHTMLQITVPINPGNSGGPLFDLRGSVIGVNSAGYRGMQGLNFAIPSRDVREFLRNRSAFAVDDTRDEHGVHFLPAPRRPQGR
ncbi:MAG: trypsin-like peptidase domain-containing protein [Planctomycetota bacterium]